MPNWISASTFWVRLYRLPAAAVYDRRQRSKLRMVGGHRPPRQYEVLSPDFQKCLPQSPQDHPDGIEHQHVAVSHQHAENIAGATREPAADAGVRYARTDTASTLPCECPAHCLPRKDSPGARRDGGERVSVGRWNL